jgi:hypothetical protein
MIMRDDEASEWIGNSIYPLYPLRQWQWNCSPELGTMTVAQNNGPRPSTRGAMGQPDQLSVEWLRCSSWDGRSARGCSPAVPLLFPWLVRD